MDRKVGVGDLLLIDGNNLLHRERSGVGEGALRGLLARLQRALPAGARAIVVLDGHPAPGSPQVARVSRQLDVRHAGSRTADDSIFAAVATAPSTERGSTIVVTDDRALTERVRSAGGQTRRLAWLQRMMAGQPGAGPNIRPAGIGAKRMHPPTSEPDDEALERWRPGRGATRKKGNPRRAPRPRSG